MNNKLWRREFFKLLLIIILKKFLIIFLFLLLKFVSQDYCHMKEQPKRLILDFLKNIIDSWQLIQLFLLFV